MGGLSQLLATARADLAAWGAASTAACLLLLAAYASLPDVRRTPGWQFLYSALCEIYVASGFVALALLLHPDDAATDTSAGAADAGAGAPPSQPPVDADAYADLEGLACARYRGLFTSILAFDMAANCWRLLMYVDLIVVYHNPFRPNTARPLYHIIVPFASAAWALLISGAGVLCTADDATGSLNLQTLTWGLVYAPFLLFVICGGSLYAAVAWLLSRDVEHRPISLLARQRVMQHCLLYLLLYGSLLALLAISYANFELFVDVGHSPFVHIVVALTAGRPLFGVAGWFLINRLPQRAWRALLRRGGGLSKPSSLREPLNADSATGAYSGGGDDGGEDGGAPWLRWRQREDGAPSGGGSAEAAAPNDAGFKGELRYELMLDVAGAISELAEREAGKRVRNSAAAAAEAPAYEIRPPGVGAAAPSSSAELPGAAAAMEPPGSHHGPQPRVQHYAVAHFRAIRAAFGIAPEAFAAAFETSSSNHPEWSRQFFESVTEGASGSFFYWVRLAESAGSGYIVKQITKREKDVLMGILPAYKEHVQVRGGASLLQYLSCHSLRLRWRWAGKVYFVVMRNFFPVRPQLSFDLKGATANRRALSTWQLHQVASVASKYNTLRDWEWMDIGMTTDLEPVDAARLWAVISADTELLQRKQLLDYSLLVGIYRPPANLGSAQKRAQLIDVVRQCAGTALISRDRQKVYLFGIIDVLEKFNLRWRLQRWALRLLYGLAMRWTDSDGISAMPPPLYADRFRTFVSHEVLHLENPPQLAPVDESWREGYWRAWLKQCLGVYGGGARRPRSSGLARWQRLWERRRRGLVKKRIDMEHDDFRARIRELEEHVQLLEYELGTARGVHPSMLDLKDEAASSGTLAALEGASARSLDDSSSSSLKVQSRSFFGLRLGSP